MAAWKRTTAISWKILVESSYGMRSDNGDLTSAKKKKKKKLKKNIDAQLQVQPETRTCFQVPFDIRQRASGD